MNDSLTPWEQIDLHVRTLCCALRRGKLRWAHCTRGFAGVSRAVCSGLNRVWIAI